MHTTQCTHCKQSMLYTAHCIMCTTHCKLCITYYALCTTHCKLYTALHCTALHTSYCTHSQLPWVSKLGLRYVNCAVTPHTVILGAQCALCSALINNTALINSTLYIVQYCNVHCTILQCALYNSTLYIVQYCTVQYGTALALCNTVPCRIH